MPDYRGPLGVSLRDIGVSADVLTGWADAAEAGGYSGIWMPDVGGHDALSTLAAFAATTRRVLLGTGVVPVFSRSPVLLAQTAATMDDLSGGRFVLGLRAGATPPPGGTGGAQPAHAGPRGPHRRRGAAELAAAGRRGRRRRPGEAGRHRGRPRPGNGGGRLLRARLDRRRRPCRRRAPGRAPRPGQRPDRRDAGRDRLRRPGGRAPRGLQAGRGRPAGALPAARRRPPGRPRHGHPHRPGPRPAPATAASLGGARLTATRTSPCPLNRTRRWSCASSRRSSTPTTSTPSTATTPTTTSTTTRRPPPAGSATVRSSCRCSPPSRTGEGPSTT